METKVEIKKLPKSRFPKQLLEIPQPPKELWILGDLPPADFICLCIVGSRKCTSYGKEACEKIIEGLRGYPIIIVSGFAMGIDTIAHKKAMQVGLKTLVFPGSGLSEESMYPKTNIQLVREVLQNDGCLISEFKPEFKATQWGFPMRNRLMAGISKAVLIIEAEEKSGTMITARMATEYNRDILAVPGSIFSTNSKGTNKLIRMGATPITTANEVLDALGFKLEPENLQQSLFENATNEEKKILELLREVQPRDDLIRMMKCSTAEANATLSIMEIKGLIKEEFGEIRKAI